MFIFAAIFDCILLTYMARKLKLILLFAIALLPVIKAAAQQPEHPDTVRAGIYITSIHDIDFKQRDYAMNMWLWLRYKKKEFDFLQNLEVPQAKSVNKSFSTIDTSGDEVYLLMKLECIMSDSWRIEKFPFDKQKLRFSIENSQFDSRSLVFVIDTLGKHLDPRYAIKGWQVDSLNLTTGTRIYETNFGDKAVPTPHSEYSNFKVVVNIERDAMGLFWKLFLGMYVSFLIAYVCFYIHADSFDSRFGLSVGGLFAVVGNKYIVDSSLPESSTFTLVDTLHGITLVFILGTIACNAFSLQLFKKGKEAQARKLDNVAAQVFLIVYLLLNAFFIARAVKG